MALHSECPDDFLAVVLEPAPDLDGGVAVVHGGPLAMEFPVFVHLHHRLELVADLERARTGGRDIRPLDTIHALRLARGVERRSDLEMPDTDRAMEALVDQCNCGAGHRERDNRGDRQNLWFARHGNSLQLIGRRRRPDRTLERKIVKSRSPTAGRARHHGSDRHVDSGKRGPMGKLIYSMSTSADGFIEGPDGDFSWGEPDEELFRFHTDRVRQLGAHLCGRRLYETMLYWETADQDS